MVVGGGGWGACIPIFRNCGLSNPFPNIPYIAWDALLSLSLARLLIFMREICRYYIFYTQRGVRKLCAHKTHAVVIITYNKNPTVKNISA
jgi:hypothetical protein